MKTIKIIIYILLIILLIIGIVYLSFTIINNFSCVTFDANWFNKLSAISTSIASIGGLLLLLVTILYLVETKKMVKEMINQSKPLITAKIIPDNDNFSFLKVVIKNIGSSPACDLSFNFNPDLPYNESTLNELKMLQNMPFLDNGEKIEFFFDTSYDYFLNKNNPMESDLTIKYKTSISSKKVEKKLVKIILDERINQVVVDEKRIHHLVKEVEELKQGILILLSEMREKNE